MRALALLGFVATLLVSGCGRSADSPAASGGEIVATYAGTTLTSERVLDELKRLPAPSRTYLSSNDRKRQFVDNLILNDLLFSEGKKAGYDHDAEIERQVEDLRRRLIVQRVTRQFQTPPEVSDEQVQKYYDDNPDLYSTTQIRASHILVKEEATAKQLSAELKQHPEKFAELARERSTDASTAPKGGDLGLFGAGRMVPDFERVAFRLKVGEISEPVKTQYGYHLVTVTERKDGQPRPFDQVKEQIRATLRSKGQQEQTQTYFDGLKRQANVIVNDDVVAKITPPPAEQSPPPNPHAGFGGH